LQPCTILSFDVEEHWRIEAAAHLSPDSDRKARDAARVAPVTRWLLDTLAQHQIRATFFVVGELACAQPELVTQIHRAGHELASHGWDHRSVLRLTPDEFRLDVRQSKAAIEQIIGEPVRGYRAPTFSIVRKTAWALDILAEEGYTYDSSIYPVRHDRYGVPDAPRGPFRTARLIEFPPARLDVWGLRLPMGGGGYFRIFPLALIRAAAHQSRQLSPGVAMLYFHPWEFDPEQERLPLGRVSGWRTYMGLNRTRGRLEQLCREGPFLRACDVVEPLCGESLPSFTLLATK